jgi:adenylosuccinate synthase
MIISHKVLVGYHFKDDSVKVELAAGSRLDLSSAEPIYATIPGWKQDISGVRLWNDLPGRCKYFIKT